MTRARTVLGTLTALAALLAWAAPSLAGGSAAESTVAVRGTAVERIGPWRVARDPTLAAAQRAFGAPDARRRVGGRTGCHVRWRAERLLVVFANFGGHDACSAQGGRAQAAVLTGPAWRTARGLRAGAGVAELRRLYPRATRHGSRWWLARRFSRIGEPGFVPVLAARVRAGRVIAFEATIGAAGD